MSVYFLNAYKTSCGIAVLCGHVLLYHVVSLCKLPVYICLLHIYMYMQHGIGTCQWYYARFDTLPLYNVTAKLKSVKNFLKLY